MAVVRTKDRHSTLERILDLPFFRKKSGIKKRASKNKKIGGPDNKKTHSIIVYVFRRRDADNVADYLVGRGYSAKAYHAGMSPADRRRVQSSFMVGTTSIAVATVAFGMGLDKSDVRGVIHFHMPRSPEHYVQEAGRAGRDGRDAWCYLMLTPDSSDFLDAHSLAYSDAVDESQVRRLLGLMVKTAKKFGVGHIVDDSGGVAATGAVASQSSGTTRVEHVNVDVNVCLEVDKIVQQLDLDQAAIETIMCRMALRSWYQRGRQGHAPGDVPDATSEHGGFDGLPILDMRPRANIICIVSFVRTAPMKLAGQDPSGVVREIMARGKRLSTQDLQTLSGVSSKDIRENERQKAKMAYSARSRGRGDKGGSGPDREGGGGGYAQKETPSFMFNLDELLASVARANRKKDRSASMDERFVRRTLDHFRARGEITTTWQGPALRAHMHLLPGPMHTLGDAEADDLSSGSNTKSATDAADTVDQVSKDLWNIANTLTTTSVGKVEGMFRAASRAAVDVLSKNRTAPPPSKQAGSRMFTVSLEIAGNEAFQKSAELLELGLSRYFQDQDDNSAEPIHTEGGAAATREDEESAYETARLARIKENKMELVRLGLLKMSEFEEEFGVGGQRNKVARKKMFDKLVVRNATSSRLVVVIEQPLHVFGFQVEIEPHQCLLEFLLIDCHVLVFVNLAKEAQQLHAARPGLRVELRLQDLLQVLEIVHRFEGGAHVGVGSFERLVELALFRAHLIVLAEIRS